jgi:hypothetical protein
MSRPFLLVAVVSLLCGGACTALVDHDAIQCTTDADCATFGGHPYCRAGACVPSGLGPANCFSGTPARPADFLNQCSTAACFSFDDCQRVHLCGASSGGPDAALLAPPVATPAAAADAAADAAAAVTDGGSQLPACVDASSGRGQVVILTGSSNFPPLLAKLAPLIVASGFTPVYQVTSSCAGVAAVLGSNHTIFDPAAGKGGKTAQYYRSDGTSVPCSLGLDGATVDVGESDIFASTCAGFDEPSAGVVEYLGPIQAMLFVTPGASRQTAISAEAARMVFGMGGAGGVTSPWTDPALYFVRNQTTGTQQMIAKAIGVPAGAFWGVDRGTAATVDSDLRVISDPTLANQAIGIISADYYDADRANLNALAFKAEGQGCAYLPDSTQFTRDKQNVRDGHYPIWGPTHFFTAVASGVPVSPGAAAFVSIVSVPNIAQPLLDAFIGSSLVPACAMRVQRTSELGPTSAYTPPFVCGCYFEASVEGSPPADCTRCKTANDCADPARRACNLGFCETR